MAQRVEPRISTHTLTLDLSPFDPALAAPLFAHLSLLGPVDGSVMLFVGGEPLPFSMSRDASVAMQRPGQLPAATTLSKGTSASLALSTRLAKRYSRQIFLSLDLSSFGDTAVGGGAERAMQPLERALVIELDRVLERKGKGAVGK